MLQLDLIVVLGQVKATPTLSQTGPHSRKAGDSELLAHDRSRFVIQHNDYYYHKCQSKGNQLELWAAVHKLSIYQAAMDLCRALGRDVPEITRW